MLKGLAVSLTDGGTSLPLQDAAISDPQKPRLFDGVAQVEKGHGGLFPQTARERQACSQA
jgi:hypothetical protein